MYIDTSTSLSTSEYKKLPRHVMDFLKSIDTDETILVVTDFGKGNFVHRALFSELSEFLLMETHHMKIRVGGNSYRFASQPMKRARGILRVCPFRRKCGQTLRVRRIHDRSCLGLIPSISAISSSGVAMSDGKNENGSSIPLRERFKICNTSSEEISLDLDEPISLYDCRTLRRNLSQIKSLRRKFIRWLSLR